MNLRVMFRKWLLKPSAAENAAAEESDRRFWEFLQGYVTSSHGPVPTAAEEVRARHEEKVLALAAADPNGKTH